jgi:DNA-binding SARP family transcriptional activator
MLTFSILGPIEVRDGGREVALPRRQQRALLALLLLDANRVVLADVLKDRLWAEEPPPSATAMLHNRISELRKLLGSDVIETRPAGYVLRVEPAQVDLLRFEELVQRARSEPPAERAQSLRDALGLWRGDPLADLTYEPCAPDAIAYLANRRLDVLEQRFEADLDLGRHAEVVGELESLVAQHGERENLVGQLMRALSQGGRQSEAIRVYHDCRQLLDEQLGVPPGPSLQQRYREVIRHDPNVAPPSRDGRTHAGIDRYAQVVRALLAGRVVPVLGPHAATGAPAAAPPDPAAAAEHLAREFRYPPGRPAGLTRVAQWVALTAGIGPLYDELHSLYGVAYAPTPVHRMLAKLPHILRAHDLPLQVIATTCYDSTLERAFADVGEDVDVLSYVAIGRDRGRFLHLSPDGSRRVIDEPNVDVGITPEERTIILKVHGGTIDRAAESRDSYVVSEDDYIDYVTRTQLSALLPVGLAARLSRSHFLFLGYDLEDWSLRVFLRRLWGEERVGYRSWAVGQTADAITAEYWRQCGVETLDGALDEYVEGLMAALEDAPRVGAST